MSLSIAVAGTTYSFKYGSLKIEDTIDMRSICDFVIEDVPGTTRLTHGMPVTVTDSINGLLFAGFVDQPDEQNLYPSSQNEITVTCMDMHYLADKRRPTRDYNTNMAAGDIVTDMDATYLAAEGVTAGYAYRHDTTNIDFATGTLSGVSATLNVGDGDLELTTAGSTVTKTDTLTADFAVGTLTSVDAQSNQLNLHAYNVLKFTATNLLGAGNAYVYWQIWAGSQSIASGDTINYDVWISSTSPQIMAAVDIICTDGTTMRDVSSQGVHDQFNIHAHPGSDLNGFANDQWYTRNIDISLLNGKTAAIVAVAFEGDTAGDYQAYFRNIIQRDSFGALKLNYYDSTASPYAPTSTQPHVNVVLSNIGYTGVLLTEVTAYDQTGNRISGAISINAATIPNASLVSWTSLIPTGVTPASTVSGSNAPITPDGTTLSIYTSIDNLATWQLCTFKAAIPDLMPGCDISSRSIYTKAVLAIAGTTPEVSPILTDLTTTITSSYSSGRSDLNQTVKAQADFNTGTYTNTAWDTNLGALPAALSLAGYQTKWDAQSGSTGNMTLFNSVTASKFVDRRRLAISAATGGDARVRSDPAPNSYQNFRLDVDVTIPGNGNCGAGVVYRTTGWQNNNDTYAYTAMLNQDPHDTHTSTVQLGRGTNSSTGAGSYTSISEVSLPAQLVAGTSHRLTIVVSGSTHQISVDGVQYISVSDATYSAAGEVAFRVYNSTGTMKLHRAVTAGTAYHTLDLDDVILTIADGTAILVDAGGANPETVYAYGAIPASTSKTTTINITTNSAGSTVSQADWTPAFSHAAACSVTVASTVIGYFDNYGIVPTLSGTWQSLNYAVGLGALLIGDSLIQWEADNTPSGASVGCQTSIDSGSTWQSATNGGQIPGMVIGGAAPTNVMALFTLTALSADQVVTLNGFTIWVTNAFSASGSRVAPVLPLTPVGRAGASNIYWTAQNDLSPLIVDTFAGRTTTPGQTSAALGTASGGAGWTVQSDTHATLSVGTNASEGNVFYDNAGSGYGVFIATIGAEISDSNTAARFRLDSSGTSNFVLYARYTNASNWYSLSLDLLGDFSITRNVAGTTVIIATMTAIGFTTGEYLWLRFQVQGQTLAARMWVDGQTEPLTWALSIVDSGLAGPGYSGIGATSFSTSAALGTNFDSLTINQVTLGVDVSPDGTTWTDVSALNGQPLPTSLIYAQPDPFLDFFATNSNASYTQTDLTGGSAATWSWQYGG